ncbi:unnamed protein product [Miscanthus lutarioriparius]|uniref:F-box domain-containing protein n=1 Tax=Miscanthus lutarioriparius TaxID=422564 RepID=A0A811RAF3_9POAL|nr:unnamed protein product [Miscanthus lutarioriparius]
MASAPAPAPALAAPTLPVDILEDIFLRLHEAADLARASAVCSSFRRAACDRGFLRRFRSLHPPPVLGVLAFENPGVLLHAKPPHRSAPAARALAQAADFSFSFVPRGPNYGNRVWRVWDALDGRVLLSMNRYRNTALEDLVVCDPLHRRYVQIPPTPGELVASNRCHDDVDFEPFLAPALKEEEMHELSFRVICNVRSSYKVVTLVFSSVTANWRGATSISFLPDRLVDNPRSLVRYYVRGCFYWTCASVKHMLLLDPREMKLTLVKLPHIELPRFNHKLPVIVDAGEDKLGVVTVGYMNNTLDLDCKTWWNNDDGMEDWQHKIIPLPELGYEWYIKGAADSYLLLKVIRKGSEIPKQVFYILEVKTLSFERLHVSVSDMGFGPPRFFASFPPPLSLPTI